MKKILVIIALVTLSCACSQRPQDTQSVGDIVSVPPTPVTPERIVLVNHGGQTLLYIYKIDGHEYIASTRGGIIHSESCPCKTNLGRIKL